MPDSTDPSRDNSKSAVLARLSEYKSVPANKRQEVHDLPRWVKTALIQWAVDGLSYNEAAKRVGKAGSTLSKYAKSPAAKKWLGELEEFLSDPVSMAKAYMSANALSITLERFVFLEAALAAGDYKEGDRIARDLQDRMGIVAKKNDASKGVSLNINLGGAGVEIPTIEAEWEDVTPGEDDDE